MCGRFCNCKSVPETAADWSAEVADEAAGWTPQMELRPTDQVPVLLWGSDRPRRLGLMTWGWSRDFARSGALINARSEDVLRKPTFSEAARTRRCLVPATAWFEWMKLDDGKRKAKHILRPAGPAVWAIAGIWEMSIDKTGNKAASVVLLTMSAHASIKRIHDRMPGVVGADQACAWIAGPTEDALQIIRPLEAIAEPA